MLPDHRLACRAVISVVMPAHNEEGYLEPAVKSVLATLGDDPGQVQVVVVQNGSSDSTSLDAARLAAEHECIVAVDLPEPDYGAALRAGFLRAEGEIVLNFDVDLVDFDFSDRALELMAAEPDVAVVVGTKRGPGAEDRRSLARRLVTAAFSTVLRLGFGLRISDTHGLKALRRRPLRPLVEQCRFGRDIFDTELIIRAERVGLDVREIPVAVADTRPPRTPITRRIPRTLVGLAELWIALHRTP